MVDFIRRHWIMVVIFVVLIGGGVTAWLMWPRSYMLSVTVSPETSGYTMKIYRSTDKGVVEQGAKPVVEFVKPQTFSLRKGNYVVVGGGNQDFEMSNVYVNLSSDKSVSLSPQYTKEKLNTLLSQERESIQAAARASIRGLNDSYALGVGELFGLGDWYGTVIYPNLSSEALRLQYVDTYRLVMKKEGDTWKPATNPPELILGAPDFPSIPKEILTATNNQKIP